MRLLRNISKNSTNWNIKLIDTGEKTMTGGRLKRLKEEIGMKLMLTYGTDYQI